MDCCNTKEKKDCCKRFERQKEDLKGGNKKAKMERKTMMWIIIGILVIATIFLTIKASSIGSGAVQATGAIVKTAVSAPSSGMVGGC